MITKTQARKLRKSITELPMYSALMDDAIREAVKENRETASVDGIASLEMAELLLGTYQREGGYAGKVSFSGSDRAYSPRDEWTVTLTIDL